MGTHTISNSSTFRGWLESMGLDDMIFHPCDCIFGDTEPEPVPIPGARFNRQMQASQRSRASQRSNQGLSRNASARGSVRKTPAGRTQSNADSIPEDREVSVSPFAAIFGIMGATSG